MKILIDGVIFKTSPFGGIARYFHETLTRIAERNDDVKIFILCEESYVPLLPKHAQIFPVFFKAWNFRPYKLSVRINAWRKKQFELHIKELEPDIFHSSFYTVSPCDNVKSVATVYDLIDYKFPFMMPNGPGFVEHQSNILSKADHVISISKSTTELATDAFNLNVNKFTTIYLDASKAFQPVALEVKTRFRETYTHGMPYFLFVGDVNSYKNLATLIRAFGLIKDSSNNYLLIAGHSLKTINPLFVDLIIQHQIEDRVIRLNHPDDRTLCEAYNAADAFVFPSLQEGFGIPLVEAMRCGTPIIASDIPVFREICGDAALFFNPHSEIELAERLTTVVEPEIHERMSDQGKDRAQLFSWDEASKEIERVYSEVTT